MPSFLCKFMCSLVIPAALFSLAPRAAADAIVIFPNGTLTDASINFQSCPSSGGGGAGTVTLSCMIVNAPLAGNPDLAQSLAAGQHLPQVIAEFLYTGTNWPEETPL